MFVEGGGEREERSGRGEVAGERRKTRQNEVGVGGGLEAAWDAARLGSGPSLVGSSNVDPPDSPPSDATAPTTQLAGA